MRLEPKPFLKEVEIRALVDMEDAVRLASAEASRILNDIVYEDVFNSSLHLKTFWVEFDHNNKVCNRTYIFELKGQVYE
jgi:hypothetical protein